MHKPSARHVSARIEALTAELAARAIRGEYQPGPVRVAPANDNAIPYCPHTPTTKQRQLHALDHVLEVFFGGAARGGKTDGALQAALRYVHVPGYAALILRRNYTDLLLPDGILARANQWLLGKPGVRWSHAEKAFIFSCPGGGTSMVAFGHMDTELDKFRYQGAKVQLVVFDELTHFTPSQYRFMFSRLTRGVEGKLARVPLRMRSTGNPGGIGHFWVYDRFVNPETRLNDVVFLPAKLADNPHEDAEAYKRSLSKMTEVEQAQLLEGIWDALQPGDIFKTDRIILLDARPPGLMSFVRFWDLAATPEQTKTGEKNTKGDYTASCWMGMAADRSVVILDVTEDKWDVAETPEHIHLQALEDGRATSIRIEEEGGASGKYATRTFELKLAGFGFAGIHPTGPKAERAKPLAVAIQDRKVSLVRGKKTKRFLEYLHAFPYVANDDTIDSASGAYNFLNEDYMGEFKIEAVPMHTQTTGLRRMMGLDTRGLVRGVGQR